MRTLALLLCLAACDAGAKPEPKPAPAKLTTPVKQPIAVAAGYDLTYLPADSDLVIHVDVAALRKSKLWATYAPSVARLVAPGLADCEDPLGQVATVDIGLPIASELSVFVLRGIDRDKTLRCFHALTKESTQTATFDGDFVTLTSKSGAIRILTFVDARTMVMQGSKQPNKQTLQQALRLGADAPLRTNAPFVAALNKAPRAAAVTLVSRPGSEVLAAKMKQSGVELSYCYGALDLTDRLAMQYVMVVASASNATDLANLMRAQLKSEQVKQMFDRIETRALDDTVTLDIAMSESKLASLAGMVQGMLPQP